MACEYTFGGKKMSELEFKKLLLEDADLFSKAKSVEAIIKNKTSKEIAEENKRNKLEVLKSEPNTPRQWVQQFFAGGGKIKTDDMKRETGFGGKDAKTGKGRNMAEFRKRIWMHSKAGQSIDDIIQMLQEDWRTNHGGELDYQDARNEIIDVMNSYETPNRILEDLRQDFTVGDKLVSGKDDRLMAEQEAEMAKRYEAEQEMFEGVPDENIEQAHEIVAEVDSRPLTQEEIESESKAYDEYFDSLSKEEQEKELNLLRYEKDNTNKGTEGAEDAENKSTPSVKEQRQKELAAKKKELSDAESEYNKANKALTEDLGSKQVGMFEGKEQKMFDDTQEMQQRAKVAKEKVDALREETNRLEKLVDEDLEGQQKMELKEDVVGKEISFVHAGSDKTGTVNAIDKDGNYKVKINGTNYTVKPENVIGDAIKAEERIAIEKENENLKNEIDGLIKKATKKADAKDSKADAKKITKLGVPGTQQLADLPNRLFQNWIGDKVRQFEDKVAETLQRGAISQRNSLRSIADFISSFSRGIMDTREYSEAHRKILKGGINKAKQDAEDLHGQLWNLIGGDINSADRIHQVLDPDLRQTGLAFADLTAQEQQLHDLLRGINDYTHNQNYLLGKISKETYDKYKGKYVGREYDYEKDYDQTVGAKSIREILGIYKQRGDVDADKVLHSIKDPIYLTLRRYMQTGQNKSVSEYADWVFRNHNELVSNTERDGFHFLGNGFGRLSNKYVARHVAEDFKGFAFNNAFMQLAYDVNKAYDGIAPRQFMKELLTVFNPQVQLGNYTSNMVFSWMGGVDLPTYLSKQAEAYRQIKNRGDVFRKLQSEGLLGTDFVSSDLVPMQDVLGAPASRNIFRRAENKARNLYSGVDDSAKIQMYLSLKDMGYTDGQAYQTIFESLQNYQNTGRIWDFASKTPVIGNSFVKFTPEMLRLLKNGMTRRPLHTMAFVGLMSAMPKLLGKYFGDDDEEIKAAGNQKGIPKIMIPYTDMSIPLSWRLGDKRVNVARFLMPIYMYDIGGENKVATDFANKFIPYQLKTTEEGGVTPFNIQDPLVAPILSTIMNKDFRDKPIVEETDDNEGLFNEANFKRLRYIARGYGGFYANTIDDIFSANITGEDFYGRRKTATDIALNTLIKIETFDDTRLREGITREFDGYERVTNKLYQEYTKKRKALQGDIDQIKEDKTMSAERKNELIGKKQIKLSDVSENVLSDISDIQKQQLDATEFYKNLSRKQPYTDLQSKFADTDKKIKQIEGRIDGKFKDSQPSKFKFSTGFKYRKF